jgi:pyruvate ferredoxin oxidoreductase gamma subunit
MWRPGAARSVSAVLELRIHGRGGQGVPTAAELLARAALDEGRHAQALPGLRSTREGAEVVWFCRIADGPIHASGPVAAPHAVIVLDPTLLPRADVLGGLRASGAVLVNTGHAPRAPGLPELDGSAQVNVYAVPATAIARRHLDPLPNVAMLGALAAATRVIGLQALARAIRGRFAAQLGERNVAAATQAHALIRERLEATLPLRGLRSDQGDGVRSPWSRA